MRTRCPHCQGRVLRARERIRLALQRRVVCPRCGAKLGSRLLMQSAFVLLMLGALTAWLAIPEHSGPGALLALCVVLGLGEVMLGLVGTAAWLFPPRLLEPGLTAREEAEAIIAAQARSRRGLGP